LVILAGMEKILSTDTEALFQARCCGMFGLENILVELLTYRQGSEPIKRKKGKRSVEKYDTSSLSEPTIPSEVHIVVLDNGRSKIVNTKYKPLLECIGCKACSSMCPRVRHRSFQENLEVPTNPRDILFLGLTQGLKFAAENGLYDCTTCGNCENLCPVDIPIPDLTLNMREACQKQGITPEIYTKISNNIAAWGNPYLGT
jgi:L-lactate utilization protein LutB